MTLDDTNLPEKQGKGKVLLIFIYFLPRFLIHHRGNSLLAAPATSSGAAKVTTKISIESHQHFHHGHVVFHWTQIVRCFPFVLHPRGSNPVTPGLAPGADGFSGWESEILCFRRRNSPPSSPTEGLRTAVLPPAQTAQLHFHPSS